jgi:hypothetical protein
MPYAGNVTEVRRPEDCNREYEKLKQSAFYGGSQNSLLATSAENYVHTLFREAPQAKEAVKGKLAVVTGVVRGQVGHQIALELAVQAEMHVLVLGKSEKGLRSVVQAIREEASRRGVQRPKLYIQRFHIASLDSAQTAAHQCEQLAHSKYDGKLHVCVHHASVGSTEAKLTADGFEYNTGCNLLTTHYLTKKWIPLLRQAATPSYKPRVVCTSSIGHCLGHNFVPQRLFPFPKEGGAPAGFIVPLDDERISEAEPGGVAFTTAEKLAAVAKVGTQVGRSKMAVVADVMHWARLYPELSFISYHTGSVATGNNGGMPGLGPVYHIKRFVSQFSPSQGARSALRAALDPDFNNSMRGAYLHADGNPWTPMNPSTIDPKTRRPFTMESFAEACYTAAEKVLEHRFTELEMEQQRDTYEPPELVSLNTNGGEASADLRQESRMTLDSCGDHSIEETTALIQSNDEDSWGTWIQEYTRERVR